LQKEKKILRYLNTYVCFIVNADQETIDNQKKIEMLSKTIAGEQKIRQVTL
jgi:hypothetical protein